MDVTHNNSLSNLNIEGIYCDSPEFIEYLHELKRTGRLIVLPVKIGEHLWRVTKPYRQEQKVTEYVVKNVRTVGKKHKVMLEVQALNVPITNVMPIYSFYRTREEAEASLESQKG